MPIKYNLNKRWKEIQSKAGVTSIITFYGIRHSFITFTMQNNADIKSIQLILGHSKSTTVSINSHASEISKREAVSKITYLLTKKENEDKIKEASI